MAYKEKVSDKVTFDEEGMILEGVLKGCSHLDALNCKQWSIQLTGSPEESVTTFLGTTVLDRLLEGEVGNLVKIEYTGEGKTRQGRKIKQFRVWSDDGESSDDNAAEIARETTGKSKKK